MESSIQVSGSFQFQNGKIAHTKSQYRQFLMYRFTKKRKIYASIQMANAKWFLVKQLMKMFSFIVHIYKMPNVIVN